MLDAGIDHYLPHYTNVNGTIYFYGGSFSNFVGGPHELKHPHTGERASYYTVEHWFQASKSSTLEGHERVRLEPETWTAKGYGQEVPLIDGWDERLKFHVMMEGLRAKFAEPKWQDELMLTGDLTIAEDSPTDFVWGIRDADNGFSGRNLLGNALMLLRDEIIGIDREERYASALNRAVLDVDRDLIEYDKISGEQN